MVVTFEQVNTVLKSLPIGYYLTRRAAVELTNGGATFASVLDDRIFVSFPMVAGALADAPEADLETVEKAVRCLLYHEVSHLFMTPVRMHAGDIYNCFEDERMEILLRKYYMKVDFKWFIKFINRGRDGGDDRPKDVMTGFYNLVRFRNYRWFPEKAEERLAEVKHIIERFSEMGRTACSGVVEEYTDAVDHLYELVRMDLAESSKPEAGEGGKDEKDSGEDGEAGDSEGSEKGDEDGEGTSGKGDGGDGEEKGDEDAGDAGDGDSGEDKDGDGDGEKDGDKEGDEEGDKEEGSGKDSGEDGERPEGDGDSTREKSGDETGTSGAKDGEKDDSGEKDGEDTGDGREDGERGAERDEAGSDEGGDGDGEGEEEDDDSPTVSRKAVEKLVEKMFNEVNMDAVAYRNLERIFKAAEKKQNQKGGAVNAYSGIFDPRQVALRNDYRWWVHQNPKGGLRRFAKTHLTLFMDVSGSFSRSEEALNGLVKALTQIKRTTPTFDFDIIAMGDNNRIFDSRDGKRIRCQEGNYFGMDAVPLARKCKKGDAENYQLVVFDGDAMSCDGMSVSDRTEWIRKNLDAWKVFDDPRTVVVTDTYNRTYLNRAHVTKAKVVYVERNYAETFIENVIGLLQGVVGR